MMKPLAFAIAVLLIPASPVLAKSGWQHKPAAKHHRADRDHRRHDADGAPFPRKPWRDDVPGSGDHGGPPAPGAFWRS